MITTPGAGAGAAAAGAQAAIAEAVKASGAIVQVEKDDFMNLLYKAKEPLVVQAESSFFKTSYQYLMSYKGLVFYTKSTEPLMLSNDTLVVKAKKIWVP